MSTDTQILDPIEVLTQAVDEAYARDGYANPQGERDYRQLAEAAFTQVSRAKVTTTSERAAKAVTRGSLTAALFPSLPQREAWGDEPDPDLAEKVWEQVQRKVWDLVNPYTPGAVQQLVGARLAHHLLCRTLIGTDKVAAVYVTEDLGCIKEDFVAALASAMRKAARKMGANIRVARERQPENARVYERLYKRANRIALESGQLELLLGLDSSTSPDDLPVDDGEG